MLLNVDGGSTDGTPDIVRDASIVDRETLVASHSLRTHHRISAPYHGVPGKAAALRTVFAAADLLQARAVVVLDPEIASVTPESVARPRPSGPRRRSRLRLARLRAPSPGRPSRHPGRPAALPRRVRPRPRGAARRRVRLLGPLRRALPGRAGLGERRPAPGDRPLDLGDGGGRRLARDAGRPRPAPPHRPPPAGGRRPRAPGARRALHVPAVAGSPLDDAEWPDPGDVFRPRRRAPGAGGGDRRSRLRRALP